MGSGLDATVVGYYVDAERRVHGFRREPGGAIIAIDVPGATETRALGINNNGEVVGIYNDAGGTKAFQLAPGGSPITIGNPAVPDAWSVNDDGIVAGSFTDPPGKSHGFTFPPGLGGPINVGNNFPTHLYGINNTRAMTGAMQDSPAGPFKAFYLSGSDTASFRAIPLSDVDESAAYGINNVVLPQCVDHVGTYSRSGHDHGFVHWGSNVLAPIDAVIASVTVTDTRVYAISDEWQMVGEYVVDGDRAVHGFIATPQ
ncbi:MAG TPA: hypothetical protein VKC64_16555 [Burkholderiales bacterium]|nr:hypothetical protein [Burkholderiales bacterium]